MNRFLQLLIFIPSFLIIYFGLNFYVLYRIFGLIGLKRGIMFYVILAALTVSLVITTFLVVRFYNILTRSFYAVSSVWVGILFLLFSTLLIYEILRLFIDIPQKTAGIALIVFVLLVSVAGVINASFVRVRTVEVPFDKDLDIVQLTDIHVGTIRNTGFLKEIVEKTNSLNPDIVLITGDLVDGSAPLREDMFYGLKGLKAPVYFVSGNHETYEGIPNVEPIIRSTGIKILDDKVVLEDGVQIIGVGYSAEKAHLDKTLANLEINKSSPSILLYHTPTELQTASKYGVSLMLSGHTHYGQIFPFTLLVKLAYPNIKGIYTSGNTTLYVSPGTGTWGPPMRIGSSSEITFLKLRKKA